MFFFSEEYNVYLQQDGFLDKELVRADLDNPKTNQPKWSWDRILRSPYIKQADVFCFISLKIIFKRRTGIILSFMNLSRYMKVLFTHTSSITRQNGYGIHLLFKNFSIRLRRL
jgi:trehalose/maltose hydrolase-like predicted phosphorylase